MQFTVVERKHPSEPTDQSIRGRSLELAGEMIFVFCTIQSLAQQSTHKIHILRKRRRAAEPHQATDKRIESELLNAPCTTVWRAISLRPRAPRNFINPSRLCNSASFGCNDWHENCGTPTSSVAIMLRCHEGNLNRDCTPEQAYRMFHHPRPNFSETLALTGRQC